MGAVHDHTSVFTVPFDVIEGEAAPLSGGERRVGGDTSFDVLVVEFDDAGRLEQRSQVERTAAWITAKRQADFARTGVVVVVFVHGWHHGAAWGDPHFVNFRGVLRGLAIREMERPDSRRVIGVYLAWRGDPAGYWFKDHPLLTLATFRNRYRVATRISEGDDLCDALRTITARTKDADGGAIPGQLILIGHSMGGLIVESGLLRLIRSRDLLRPAQVTEARPVTTTVGDHPVVFPDAVLSLNSAADSRIGHEIDRLLRSRGVRKAAVSPSVSYAAPLLISATSTADWVTKVAWRAPQPWRRTTGHDESRLTHDLRSDEGRVMVVPNPNVPDFGQNFHVLRPPDPPHAPTPRMVVDLPVRGRSGLDDHPPHRRYRLEPRGPEHEPRPIWNVQLPPELVPNHNDVFGTLASALLVALMQMSGAVGSLATDWEHSFEPY